MFEVTIRLYFEDDEINENVAQLFSANFQVKWWTKGDSISMGAGTRHTNGMHLAIFGPDHSHDWIEPTKTALDLVLEKLQKGDLQLPNPTLQFGIMTDAKSYPVLNFPTILIDKLACLKADFDIDIITCSFRARRQTQKSKIQCGVLPNGWTAFEIAPRLK
jgi:hypothetical protein